MDYYVVLGIAEDADEEMIRSAFEHWRGATIRMSALPPHQSNSSALAKRTRPLLSIRNVVAGTTNGERLVTTRS